MSSLATGSAPPAARAPSGRPAAAVWVSGTLLAAVLIACIPAYTVNVPIAEDWLMVPPLTGQEPNLWQWLWAQNNEHRLPLPRLLLLGLLQATGDLRAGMLANVLLMAAAAYIVVRGVAALRGGTVRYSDAFVPIALLHLGNWENFMWAWQLAFVLSTALTLVLLVVMSGASFWTSPWRPPAAGIIVAALPLCGANGLAFAAPIGAWLTIDGLAQWRQGGARRRAAGWVIGGVLCALLAALYYLAGYTSASWNPPTPGPYATLETTLAFLTLGFGPAALRAPALMVPLLVTVLALAGWMLARAAVHARGDERMRALRLLAYAAGFSTLAVAFGWGRAGLVPAVGLPDRYVLLAVPAIVWAYVIADIYAGRALRRGVQGALLLAVCLLLPFNVRDGLQWRDWYRAGMEAVVQDVGAGVPRGELVERHGAFLMHWSPEQLSAGMLMLREAGIGPFADLDEP